MNEQTCKICNNSNDLTYYTVREMMLGTKDQFEYFQCPECRCLQISNIPDNLGQYYPENYYSYHVSTKNINYILRSWVDQKRVLDALYNRSLIGKIINKTSKPLEYIPWIKNAGINFDSAVLDVGCGQGRLLLRMSMGGFTNLTGLDPFNNDDITHYNRINIHKSDLSGFKQNEGQFDFIMLHHSLEHMPDQQLAFQSIARLLSPNGVALIRIPLVDSYAWEHYRENWVQLDPPRHLYLHSAKSLAMLAEKFGFSIYDTVYDSAKFQFTGSELYNRGIALSASKKSKDIFTREQIKQYERRASELNKTNRGDQAAFYLKKMV